MTEKTSKKIIYKKPPQEEEWSITKHDNNNWMINGPGIADTYVNEFVFINQFNFPKIPQEVWDDLTYHVESQIELDDNHVRSKHGYVFLITVGDCVLNFIRQRRYEFSMTSEELSTCDWLDDENKKKAQDILAIVLSLKNTGSPKGK